MREPHRAARSTGRVRVAWLAALALVAVLVPACTVGPPPVCDVNWVGPATGVWSDPGNWGSPGGWTAGALPGPTHRACAPAGTTITLDAPVTVGSFDVDTLTVPADQVLTIAQDAHATTLQVTGTVTGTGTLTGGTLQLTGGTLAGNITTFFTTATTLAGGTITDTARALLGTGLTWTSPLQACGTAAVHTYATTTLTVPAALTTTGCPGTPAPTLTIAATGRLTLAAPFTSDVPVTTTGTLTLDHTTVTTPALTLTTTGALTGTGTLAGDLTGAGAVEPGDPTTPGDLHVTGTYTPTTGATIAIDLTGPAPSTHDTLTIDGTADLTPATYTARTSPTFAPHATDTFPTITATTLTGPPATTTLDPGLVLDTTPTTATLRTCNPDDPADTPHCPPFHLGSTTPTFGNQLDPALCPGNTAVNTPPCGPQPLIWAAINGPLANHSNGDPYATRCSSAGCGQPNPTYRPTGYDYAVDVAPADVGHPLTVATYDLGEHSRSVSFGAGAPPSRVVSATTTSGSRAITSPGPFTAADVGQPVAGYGVASGATIGSVSSATTATLSTNATATGTTVVSIGIDCNTGIAPFNAPPLLGLGSNECQTGDYGDPQNVDVQLHEPALDGRADTTNPITACHQTALASDGAATKNRWVAVCTFTPTRTGQHDLRVRNSGLPGLTDVGIGNNQFALRVTGGTTTALYPLGDASTYLVPRAGPAAVRVAHIPRWYAGHTVDLDIFDVGDGGSSPAFTVQLQGPPGSAPVTVPAPGVATSCAFNAVGATAQGPATTSPSSDCKVLTKAANSTSGIYNDKWLRIRVTLDAGYTCAADCTWTLAYDFGGATSATDRATWTVTVHP